MDVLFWIFKANSGRFPTVPISLSALKMVGVAGLEPATFRTQTERATRLRHTPMLSQLLTTNLCWIVSSSIVLSFCCVFVLPASENKQKNSNFHHKPNSPLISGVRVCALVTSCPFWNTISVGTPRRLNLRGVVAPSTSK